MKKGFKAIGVLLLCCLLLPNGAALAESESAVFEADLEALLALETEETPEEEVTEPAEEPEGNPTAAEELSAGTLLAASVKASGTCGDNLTWKLYDDGTLAISGSGAMYDYGHVNNKLPAPAPWAEYRNDIKKVTMPRGMTGVGNYAFWYCKNLESVTFGSGVTSIGKYAFTMCSALKSVDLPANLQTIGESAFAQCSVLAEVDMPDVALTIGTAAFEFCYKLAGVEFRNAVSVGSYAFYSCTGMKELTFAPGKEAVIGDYAFYRCLGSAGAVLPEGVVSVGKDAFLELVWIRLPSTLESFGDYIENAELGTHLLYTGTEEDWAAVAKGQGLRIQKGAICFGSAEDGFTGRETCAETIWHCSACDGDFAALPKAGGSHEWDGGVVTVKPTLANDGVGEMVYACPVCGETKTESIGYFTGDINGDGEVGILDVLCLMRHLIGDPVRVNPATTDVNGNETVGVQDVICLLRILSAGEN